MLFKIANAVDAACTCNLDGVDAALLSQLAPDISAAMPSTTAYALIAGSGNVPFSAAS